MRHYPFLAVLVQIQIRMSRCTIARELIRTLRRLIFRQMAASTVIHLNRDGDQITAVITKIKISNQSALKIYCLGHSRQHVEWNTSVKERQVFTQINAKKGVTTWIKKESNVDILISIPLMNKWSINRRNQNCVISSDEKKFDPQIVAK